MALLLHDHGTCRNSPARLDITDAKCHQVAASKVAGILCLCSVGLYGAEATAQPAVPIEQKPAHRLVLQNEHVRVFEIRLPPGEDTLWHVHQHDGVSVRLADATIEDQPQHGQSKTLLLRQGAVAYGATLTALTHRVRNVGETMPHSIGLE